MNADSWTKSTRCCHTANCVEVQWAKSSASVDNGNCVEVGRRKVDRPDDDEETRDE